MFTRDWYDPHKHTGSRLDELASALHPPDREGAIMTRTQAEQTPAELEFLGQLTNVTTRRRFLQWAGVTIGVGALGCRSGDRTGPSAAVMLGSGDTGILNYAYALEQLEAAFYTQVVATPYAGASGAEVALLRDIRDHEVVHREFLRVALGSAAIRTLRFDFTSVNFTSRASVLGTAQVFEDLGVAAYNGAGALLVDANLLLIAGKIVSVEARHASAIRDLISPGSTAFAGDDVVTTDTGLDRAFAPAMVLAAAGPFVTDTLDASSLPTS